MLVELTNAAASDVLDAAIEYEHERAGLGFRFDAEIDRALSLIADNPGLFAEVSPGVRRALLRVFPFSVFFVLLADRARVFAVLHQHRHPDTWKRRDRG